MNKELMYFGVGFAVISSAVALVSVLKGFTSKKEKKKSTNKILELESLIVDIVNDFSSIKKNQLKKELRQKKTSDSLDKIVSKMIEVTLDLKNISKDIHEKNGKK